MYTMHRLAAEVSADWADVLAVDPRRALSPYADLRFAVRMRFNPLWRALCRRLVPGSRVLDAGCGTGQWSRFLLRRGVDTVGLDSSARLVSLLQDAFPQMQWRHGQIQELPFDGDSFSHVISWGVIEHDERGPRQALCEFHRVLRPSGCVLVTVPLDSPRIRRLAELSAPPGNPAGFFQYLFTPAELAGELRRAGFVVEETSLVARTYVPVLPELEAAARGLHPVARTWIRRALQPLTWFRRDTHTMVFAVGRKP